MPIQAAAKPAADRPDLHSQLEDLFDEVWRGEADWTLNDKIDLAVGSNRKGQPE
jgi:hypothetical protein